MADAVVLFNGAYGRRAYGSEKYGQGLVTLPTATGSVGSVTLVAEANVTPTGISATGSVGSVTVNTTEIVSGLSATGSVGSVTLVHEANITPIGISATGEVGLVFIWSNVDDTQTPSWSAVTDTQTPNWSAVTDTQTPNWQEAA